MSELEFAEALAMQLGRFGHAELVYITAEFAPFSSAQRPDILFVPKDGPFARQYVVVELRLAASRLSKARAYKNISDHKAFAEDTLAQGLAKYIVLTTEAPDEVSSRIMSNARIHLLVANLEDVETSTVSIVRLLGVDA